MRLKLPVALQVLLLVSLISCKKHASSPSDTTNTLGSNVYIAGSVNGRAVYWNNGVIHYLTDTTVQQWSFARQIVFSGSDTLICGSEELFAIVPNAILPVYWKNGLLTKLPGGPEGQASSLCVSGSDVFISGELFNGTNDPIAAVYWKNGVLDTLSFGGAGVGQIILSGTDIYAIGEQTINDSGFATFWKNGLVRTILLTR